MTTVNTLVRTPRKAVLAALALGTLPGMAIAAGANDTERAVREIEMRREQEQAERERNDRMRTQQQALESQQDAIRRLEEARQRLSENSREVAELSSRIGSEYVYGYAGSGGGLGTGSVSPRSLLGISLAGGEPRVGARVAEVSPGGAAAEAGLQAGDVITQLDELDLTRDSNPDRALTERMSRVAPDTKVKVGVLRNGRRMNFDVTTRAVPPPVVAPLGTTQRLQLQGRGDALADIVRMRDANGRQEITIRREGPGAPLLQIRDNGLGNMEFATLSAGLGRYFGVESGVLVVRAGADAPYGLQDGDVILSIDGRATTTAQHLGRILRSYQPGESFKLRIQRDRKATELSATVPSRRE